MDMVLSHIPRLGLGTAGTCVETERIEKMVGSERFQSVPEIPQACVD